MLPSSFKTLASRARFLIPPWSVDSSAMMENGDVLSRSWRVSMLSFASTPLVTAVHFVLPHVIFFATSESGHTAFKKGTRWSATTCGRLCSTTKAASRTSLYFTIFSVCELPLTLGMSKSVCVFAMLDALIWCFLPAMCFSISDFPPL